MGLLGIFILKDSGKGTMNPHQVSPSYPLYLLHNGMTGTDIEEDVACSRATEKSIPMTTFNLVLRQLTTNHFTVRNQD